MADMKVPNSVGSEQRGHAQSKNQYFWMSVRRRTFPSMLDDTSLKFRTIFQHRLHFDKWSRRKMTSYAVLCYKLSQTKILYNKKEMSFKTFGANDSTEQL